MKKRQFYWILVFAFLGSILVSGSVQATNYSTKIETLTTKNKKAEEKKEIIEAGEHVIGIYDKKAKTITFSGSGELSWIPRKPYDDVTKIVIEEGITEIGFGAGGSWFHGLQELIIPKSVQKMRDVFDPNNNNPNRIVDGIFDKSNYNLKKVYNYSSVEYDPRQYEWSGWGKKNEYIIYGEDIHLAYVSPWKWMVDGKEVTKIPPNSVATAVPKKYHITYDLNGGKKGKGKWFYSYRYGVTKDLPKPKRKGYFFAGWREPSSLVYFPVRAFSKISPTHLSDVKLKAIWRKIKIVKKKHRKGFQVLVSPKKYPQLTMLISTNKQIKKQLGRKIEDDLRAYTLAGPGIKSKTKNGMRVFNIKKFGNSSSGPITEFEKGKTYYIWFKYGSIQDYEYFDVDEEGVSYIGRDAYYFYKTKITF